MAVWNMSHEPGPRLGKGKSINGATILGSKWSDNCVSSAWSFIRKSSYRLRLCFWAVVADMRDILWIFFQDSCQQQHWPWSNEITQGVKGWPQKDRNMTTFLHGNYHKRWILHPCGAETCYHKGTCGNWEPKLCFAIECPVSHISNNMNSSHCRIGLYYSLVD